MLHVVIIIEVAICGAGGAGARARWATRLPREFMPHTWAQRALSAVSSQAPPGPRGLFPSRPCHHSCALRSSGFSGLSSISKSPRKGELQEHFMRGHKIQAPTMIRLLGGMLGSLRALLCLASDVCADSSSPHWQMSLTAPRLPLPDVFFFTGFRILTAWPTVWCLAPSFL